MKNKKGFMLSALICIFIIGVSIPLFMTNHKKIKADTITNLTNTTWLINDSPSIPSTSTTYNITFVSVTNWTRFSFSNNNIRYGEWLEDEGEWDYYICYFGSNHSWNGNIYKTIQIIGGTDVTNANLISWLQTNSTQQNVAPVGTEITHKYWSPYGVIQMSDNQVVGDNDIQYTVLFNEFNSSYDETTQTGLFFKGVLTEQDPAWSYIESINGSGINILYHGTTNNLNNIMWLEFSYGDYIDTDLYNFMDLQGYWFDDDQAYLVGMNQGYVEGTIQGRALGQADGVEYSNLISRIFNGIGDLLNIQVFPNITIGLIIGLPLLLGVFIIIIKILRG